MTKPYLPQFAEVEQNRFGLRLAARLSAGANEIPHDLQERLRAGREQALARRKQAAPVVRLRTASAVLSNARTASLSLGDDMLGFWGRLTSLALVCALVVGLVAVNVVQDDDRTMEVADLDATLLTDDLPVEAYSDPGFVQYLKTSGQASAAISR
ncbi:MAG: DUF3619 family protein [Ottowia sp.]|nr:DUF3619 family protein [Ottowia sp.]